MTDDLVKGLADKMIRDAEEQIANAQTMMDQTKSLVEIMNTQMAAHLKLGEDLNARFKQVGSIMLDAHRILNGEPPAADMARATASGGVVTPHRVVERQEPVRDLDRLRALDDIKRGRLDPAGIGTLDPKLTRDPNRDPDAYSAIVEHKLPRALGGVSQFNSRTRKSEDRNDPPSGRDTGPADDKAF